MLKARRTHEEGQALVLVALLLVGLVAFLALGIDGGMAYAQRREAQNAADSGAIAGTYILRLQNHASSGTSLNQNEILEKIHQAVEAHNVPDTHPTQPHVNENVVAYFTDENGNVLPRHSTPCEIGACNIAALGGGVWGVQVGVDKPFDTYFAGVIGMDEITVHGQALSVTHAGAGATTERWALFGLGARCGGNTVKVTGANSNIFGNIHANGGVHQAGANAETYGTVTCTNCGDAPINNLAFTQYEAFASLAKSKAQLQTQGYYASGIVKNGGSGALHFGTEAEPFTYINGDLTVGTNWTINVHGLIVVEGDVDIRGTMVPLAPTAALPANSCGDVNQGSFTIASGGATTINNSGSNGGGGGNPYVNTAHPLLEHNVIKYIANETPNSCNTPVFQMSGSSNVVYGTILAPNGEVKMSGSSNTIIGSLIGDRVDISGSSTTTQSNPVCFPPQPDRIELLR